MPKVGSNYIFLAVTLIDFVVKKHENYYPQVFLRQKKEKTKNKKLEKHWTQKNVIKYITDDLEIYFDYETPKKLL